MKDENDLIDLLVIFLDGIIIVVKRYHDHRDNPTTISKYTSEMKEYLCKSE